MDYAITNETERPPEGGDAGACVARVSVCVPARDEERTIRRLLDALLAQTRVPDEIVIADGGSADATREIVRAFAASSPVPVALVEDEDALPGRARNLAIACARHEWVACIDAGIEPVGDWLEHLIEAARHDPQAQVVFGRFEPVIENFFTACAAISYCPPGKQSRTIASCLMRREAWRDAGGFREDLRSGEDLLFFGALERTGARRVRASGALVRWSLKPTTRATFRHFSAYSVSNLKAGLFRQWQRSLLVQYAIVCALVLAGLGWWPPLALAAPLYVLARAEKRIYDYYHAAPRARLLRAVLSPRRVAGVAWVNAVIDAATLRGLVVWLLRERRALRASRRANPSVKSA
jgi:glycosyltransferase involved in cell wall biosynthesis